MPMSRRRYARWDKIKKKFILVQEIAVVLETIIDLERIARNNVKKNVALRYKLGRYD